MKRVLFVLTLALAALFRLPFMHYVEFKGDEALNLFLATRPLFHHGFPPASQASSAGILNFPLLNYLLFPIVLFTLYPPTISFVIALINVLTIGGFFLLFTKYHGRLTAFLASSFLAFSPWAILYSRKIWAQDFILPLSLPFFLSIYKIKEGKKRYWILFGVSSMLLLQIHQIAGLIPIFVFFALIKEARSAWKFLCLGTLLGLIPALPYLFYMAAHTCFSCQNTAFSARLSFHTLLTFFRPLQLFSIGNFYTEFGNDYALFSVLFPFVYKISKISYLSYIALPLAAFYFWQKAKQYRFFVFVCLAYILILFAAGIEPLMHYFILLMPFFALFLGFSLAIFVKKKWGIFFIAGISLYFLSLLCFDGGFLLFLSHKGGLGGDYGAGYMTSEQSATNALAMYRKSPDFPEIKITYFTPLEYFHGYMPLGTMIYPFADLQKNEKQREKQFINQPNNPILQREIFAYYTQSPDPSFPFIITLKEKARRQKAFAFIYQQVLQEYLSLHLKRLYETPDFVLLYPQHWQQTEDGDTTVLSDDLVAVHITKQLTNLLHDPHLMLIRGSYYSFTITPLHPLRITPRQRQFEQAVFSDMMHSLIPLK